MDIYFSKQFGTNETTLEQAKPFSKCGQCNKFMKLMNKHDKLFCETCKKEYPLPKNGAKKILGD